MRNRTIDQDFVSLDKKNKKDVYDYLRMPDKNKAGQFTKEDGFKKNFPELYDEYMNYFDEGLYKSYPFQQLLYHYFNDDVSLRIGACNNEKCDKRCGFNNMKYGYNMFCSNDCALSSDMHRKKVRQTCLERYGVENVFQSDGVKRKIKETNVERYGIENYAKTGECHEKMKHTCLERYGVEYYQQTNECKNRVKHTCVERYGVENYNQTDESKKKHRQTYMERYGVEHYNKTDESKEKHKSTCLKKYGVEHYFQSEEKKEKTKNTNFEKYGTECYQQTDEFKERVRNTCMEKYGVENYFQSEEKKRKSKETCLEKYGTECYQQTDEFKERVRRTCLERYGSEHAIGSDEVRKKIINSSIEKYGDTNPYRGKLHNKLMNEFPEITGFDTENNTYMCRCMNDGCDMCENKSFSLPSPIFRRRKYNSVELCPILNPIKEVTGTSEIENDILLFIKSIYDGVVLEHDRTVLDGKEIDIYIPDKNLAIELNGLYWHSEIYKNETYHQDKSVACVEKNIQMIHIWEDDWVEKKDVVKDIILSKFGLNKRIFARKCSIREVSPSDAREFIERNHLQGNINAKVRIGLYFGDELVEIATFGKLRAVMNMKGDDTQYELYRLCSKLGYNVIGGVSKIMKYFIEKYNPREMITYASFDISNGNAYDIVFERVSLTKPGYYWSKGGKKYNRFNFTKHKLVKMGFDKNKTENEIMHELGYYKVFDSGNIKFRYIR